MRYVIQMKDTSWVGFRGLTEDFDVYGEVKTYDSRDEAERVMAALKAGTGRVYDFRVWPINLPKRVTLELTVEPAEGNDSDFWEPNGTLVQYGLADTLLGFEKDGWRITRIQAADE